MTALKPIAILFAAAVLSGCAPYMEQVRPALRAYYDGNFKEAAELAEGIHPRRADKLLAFLDKGTIFHAAGLYKKSIKYFTKAADMADARQSQAVLSHVGAVFTNDNTMPYLADPYERLFIHVFQIMNYAAMDNLEDSLVEVRRIDTIFPDTHNSFASYLSGLVWESGGLCNDAHIDFKRVLKLGRRPLQLDGDIERTGICAGLLPKDREDEPEKRPNLIVIAETGRAPVKISKDFILPAKDTPTDHAPDDIDTLALQIVPVPAYEERTSYVEKAVVRIGGERLLGEAEEMEDVAPSLAAALEKKMPGIVARAAARLAVKESAAVAVGEKVDYDLGMILGAVLLLTNQADLRSWQTLPGDFLLWRGYIPPGTHRITLDFLDEDGKTLSSVARDVEIKGGETELITVRNAD